MKPKFVYLLEDLFDMVKPKPDGYMIYNASDIAYYVVNCSNLQNYRISNLKLQEILYFLQVYFLISKGYVCFRDKLVALGSCPVVPAVHSQFKEYGSLSIPYINPYLLIDYSSIWNTRKVFYDENTILFRDKKLIRNVVNSLSKYDESDLLKLIHKQDPWIKALGNKKRVITIRSIKDYFIRGLRL